MPKIIPVATFDCVVFGATGDLTLRKLLPALYYRFRDGQMPPDSHIIAAARSDLDDDAYRKRASKALQRACRARGPRPRHRGPVLPARSATSGWMRPIPKADWHALTDMLDARSRARLLSGHIARSLRPDLPQHRRARPGHRAVARGAGEADRPRPRLGARRSTTRSARCSARRRPSASTTTWARRRCRTCWRCASPTRSSSGCGMPT